MHKNEVVAETLASFPDTPNRTLARTLHKLHQRMFPSVEIARSAIRMLRGSNGSKNRKYHHLVGNHHRKELGWQALLPKPLPQGDEPVALPFPSKVLVLSDIHLPYHDNPAVKAVIREGLKQGVTDILLNGDTMDNYSWSRFEPDVRKRDPKAELDSVRVFLKALRKAFPKARIWFKNGNHEDRWYAYMNRHAPVLLQTQSFNLAEQLGFATLGIHEIGSRQLITAGSLLIVHGHEISKGVQSPLSPARRLWMAFEQDVLGGHFHQESVYDNVSGLPKRHGRSWTTGCLCYLHPDYAPVNKWSHGAAIVRLDKHGRHSVQLLTVENGKVVK